MFNEIKKGLVVSCQALDNEPLHGGDTMAKMASAAKEGGAIGIRANGFSDIQQIKKKVDLPIIGLNKKDYQGYQAYITPTKEDVDVIVKAGADIIAIDATDHSRPFPLKDLIQYIKDVHQKEVLADISTYEEAVRAEKLGCDAVATTMVGYTPHTKGQKVPDFDLLEKLIQDLKIPVIAEGNFNTPEDAKKAIQLGAHAVIVGSAITRPQVITRKFYQAVQDGQ